MHKPRRDALEALLKPKGRVLVFFHSGGDEAYFEARLAAFRVENGVRPEDELHSVRITYGEPGG
jgi:hypothetical protein